MGDKEVAFTRGHLRIYIVSSPGMSHSRMDNTKVWARKLEREVSRTQTLCWEQDNSNSLSGLVNGAFASLSLDHRGPAVAMRTLAGGG